MNSYTLLDTMTTALADDAELTTNSNLWTGSDHHVFIDQDQVEPPGQESGYVLIHLHSPAKNAAEDQRIVEHGFIVSVDLRDPDDAVRSENNASEYSATERLDILVERIIAVMRAAKPDSCVLAYEYACDTVTHFPVFTADILIKLDRRVLIGQDPLE